VKNNVKQKEPMCIFAGYSNLFGAPRQGFHSARLFGLARNDLLGTLAAAIGVALLAMYVYGVGFWEAYGVAAMQLLLLGWVLHMLFCVKTPLTAPFIG